MITTTVQTSGFREMEALLMDMKGSTARNTTARSMIKSLDPTLRLAIDLSPKKSRELAEGIRISRKATKAKAFKKSDLEVYIGPIKNIGHAIPQEFGTVNHGPHPFMRPAWDSTKYQVLTNFGYLLWENVEKSIARAARKAAREAAKMKRGS